MSQIDLIGEMVCCLILTAFVYLGMALIVCGVGSDDLPLEDDLIDNRIRSDLFMERILVNTNALSGVPTAFQGKPNNAFLLSSDEGQLAMCAMVPSQQHIISY